MPDPTEQSGPNTEAEMSRYVDKYLPAVMRIAAKFSAKYHLDQDECESAACVALWECARDYKDPELPKILSLRIRDRIKDEFSRSGSRLSCFGDEYIIGLPLED